MEREGAPLCERPAAEHTAGSRRTGAESALLRAELEIESRPLEEEGALAPLAKDVLIDLLGRGGRHTF
jgi:hypothetical protein